MRKPFAIPGKIVLLVVVGVAVYAFWKWRKINQVGAIAEGGNEDVEEIRKYVEDRTSTGEIQTYSKTITDELTEIKVVYSGQSLALSNDGLSTVYVWINDMSRPRATVRAGEELAINFEVHKLNKIFLQCDTGNSTTIRAVVKD